MKAKTKNRVRYKTHTRFSTLLKGLSGGVIKQFGRTVVVISVVKIKAVVQSLKQE